MKVLSGSLALVTGAGSGIGRAIAVDLAQAGANMIIVGRRRGPLEETITVLGETGTKAEAMLCDLTDDVSIEHLATRIIDTHGGVDILVNNAGFSSQVRSVRYISSEEWRSVMDVNTLGPAMLTRRLLTPMIAAKRGHVVMISSMAGIRPSVMAGAVYSAAKSAARAYMDVLAAEVRQHGIRCTTVFPGEVDTPILDNRALPPDATARATMMQPEDISAAVLMAVSLPHRANVSEIAITATMPRDMTEDINAAMSKTHAN